MVFPLPLPVIISDKPIQTSTLDEQKSQTDLLRNQQGMWTKYLQLFGLNKEELNEHNNQIVSELKVQNEQTKDKIEQDTRDKKKDEKGEKLRDKLAKFWDKIKFWKYFPDLFKNIKEIAKNSYEKVKGWIEGLAEWFWYSLVDPSGSLITTVVALIIPALGNLVTLAMNLLGSVIPQIINMVIAFLPQMFRMIETLVLKLVKMAPMFINALVKAIPILIKGLVKVLPVLVKALIKVTIALFKAVVLLIPVLLKGVWDAAKGIWKELVNAWPELKKALIDGMASLGKSILKIFDDIFGGDSSETMKKVKDFFNDLYIIMDYLWTQLNGFFKDIYDALGGEEGIMKSFEGVKKAVSDIWDSISSFIDEMMPYIEMLIPPLMKLKDVFVRVSLVVIKGLKWAFDKLMIVIGPLIDIILWLVKTFFKLLIPVVAWLIDIFADLYDSYINILEVIGKVIDWLWDWGVKVVKWFKDLWETVSKAFDKVKDVFVETWDALANAVKDGFKKLLGYFSNWFSSVKDEVPEPINQTETSTSTNTGELSGDQSLYNRTLKKTKEQLDKGRQGIEKFRETINKAFNLRSISIPNIGGMFSGIVSNAFSTAASASGIKGIIDDVKDSATFKAIEKLVGEFKKGFDSIITDLKNSFKSFIGWFEDLPLVKSAIDAYKRVKNALSSDPNPTPGTPRTIKVERQGFSPTTPFDYYSDKNLASATQNALKKNLNVKDEDALKRAFEAKFGQNVEGKQLLSEYFIRKLRGEDIKAEKFFAGSDEAITEEMGRNIDSLVKQMNASDKTGAERDKALLDWLNANGGKQSNNILFTSPKQVHGFTEAFSSSGTR
jgi:phage-related protein